MSAAPALAALDTDLAEVERSLARQALLNFTLYTKPDYDPCWHHKRIAIALERVLAGKCRRLMIFMPPQNGKSELVSRRFVPYAFGRNPSLRLILCSYTASLAEAMSRDAQAVMASREYQELFPETRLAEGRDPEKRTQSQFDIVGTRGRFVAAGVGGGIGGKTADIGIVDDPIKDRVEADSEVMRDRVWEWYTSTFAARQFGDKGSIIICQTRWHEDDLAGRLLRLARENPNAEQWEVISLPAIAEEQEAHRNVGDPLWPSRYPLEELARRRATYGEYDWASLYQQRPAPLGGGMFKAEAITDRILDVPPAFMRQARGWDTAGTEGGGDATCGVKLGEEFVQHPTTGVLSPTGRFVVLDVVHERLGPDGVDKLIRRTAALDGQGVAQREEREGGSAGLAVIASRTKSLAGVDYAGVPTTGSKQTRAKPLASQWNSGNVYLLRAPWNAKYIQEMCSFPTAKHDDMVDASSCAFNAVLMEPEPVKDYCTW